MLLSRLLGLLSISMAVLGAGVVCGQTYPNKPIRIVTGEAGGGGDFTARQIAQEMSAPLGQPVIIDNRTSRVAPEIVAKSPPDGYTLLVGGGGSTWIRPLMAKMPWDPVRDFSPISLLVREVLVIAVNPSLPVTSVKELIALAKAKPGELNYAASPVGGSTHLSWEKFKSMAGVKLVHVAYKGNAYSLTALMSGEVQLLILDASLLAPHMKSGKLRALAVTTAQPSALVPGLPTVAASGLPGYEWVGMTGIVAPAKTPGVIINRLNQEIVRLLNLPNVKEKFLNSGVEVVGSSPEQFAAEMKSDIAKQGKLIEDLGIKSN